MEENMVVNPQADTAIEVETPQADTVLVETQADAAPVEKTYTKTEFDAEVRRKINLAKSQMSNDPIYQLGRILAQEHENDPIKAIQKLREERTEKLASDPKALASAVVNAQIPMNDPVKRIAEELISLGQKGELPEGFDLDIYVKEYPEFLADAQEFGTKAAIKMATKEIATKRQTDLREAKMKQAENLPQPIRPNNDTKPAEVDYFKISSDKFREIEEAYRRADY